jgi:dTDP-4-dehydrorhamnose reductase
VIGLDRDALDLARPEGVRREVASLRPDVIFSPAAYTAVDKAEQDQEQARLINQDAVLELALAARDCRALIIHYSTDYVFAGDGKLAYVENDPVGPKSVYGRTKLGGEDALRKSGADWLCLRTSWVYAARGKNFLRTILRLAREREELRVVSDQIGAPTSARLIADASVLVMIRALQERRDGRFSSEVLHLAASGEVSWHGFASAIVEEAAALRMNGLVVKSVTPIPTSDYPTPATRPANSRLDCARIARRFGLVLPDWRIGMRLCLYDLAAHEWK